MKRVIIVGIGCVTAKYLPDALRPAGYEPLFLLDAGDFTGQSRRSVEGCPHLAVDLTDPDGVLRMLRERPDLAGPASAVSGFFDELFPLVARIAAEHGLRYPGAVAARLADKAEVVRLVPEFSPRAVVFRAGAVPEAELLRLHAGAADLVLKPAVSSGGCGATWVDFDRLTAGHVRAAIAASGLPDALEQTWIMQERLSGPLVSLEGYAVAGTPKFLGYSLRGRIGWTEVSNVYPADDRIPAAARGQCEAAVRALIARSGFQDGYFHCEFLLHGEVPRLIDANVGRLGGATVVEQIALAHGLSPAQILRHALLLPLDADAAGPPPRYRPVRDATPTMSFVYGLELGGRVRDVELPADLACVHTQCAPAGSVAPPVGTSDGAWVGMLTGTVTDARRDIDRIRIVTEHGTAAPCYAQANR